MDDWNTQPRQKGGASAKGRGSAAKGLLRAFWLKSRAEPRGLVHWAASKRRSASSGSLLASDSRRTKPLPRTAACRLASSECANERSATPPAALPSRRAPKRTFRRAKPNGRQSKELRHLAQAVRLRQTQQAGDKVQADTPTEAGGLARVAATLENRQRTRVHKRIGYAKEDGSRACTMESRKHANLAQCLHSRRSDRATLARLPFSSARVWTAPRIELHFSAVRRRLYACSRRPLGG